MRDARVAVSDYRDPSAALEEQVRSLEEEIATVTARRTTLQELLAELRDENAELESGIVRAEVEAKQRRLDRALDAILTAPFAGAMALMMSGLVVLLALFLFSSNPPWLGVVIPAYFVGVAVTVWFGRRVFRGEW